MTDVDLTVRLADLEMRNPIITAPGPPVRDAESIRRCVEGGAGMIVAKTISAEAAPVPRPNMAEVPHGFLNTELWSDLPPEAWIEREYPEARRVCDEAEVPLVASIGYSAEQVEAVIDRVAPFADGIELSTHYLGDDPKPMQDAVRAAKRVGVPVLLKLSPNVPDIAAVARAAVSAGADGLVAINSFGPCLGIDLETCLPKMGSARGYGWLSGPAIKPLAVRCVYDAARAVEVPVVGVGGVSTGEDAAEFLFAGASAVGICTAAILNGPGVFGAVASGLHRFMEAHGYGSVREMTGLTIRATEGRTDPLYEKRVPEVDRARCTACGLCATSCWYRAISLDPKARIDPELCFGCHLCLSRCRFGAIRLP